MRQIQWYPYHHPLTQQAPHIGTHLKAFNETNSMVLIHSHSHTHTHPHPPTPPTHTHLPRSNNPALFFPSPYRQLHWSYLSVFNLQLLLDPAHLCAEYSMGTVPPIQTLTDTRNILTLLSFSVLFLFGLYSIQLSTNLRRTILFGLSLIVFPYLPASNLFFPVGFVIAERSSTYPVWGSVC